MRDSQSKLAARRRICLRAALVVTLATSAPACSLGLSDGMCISEKMKNWDQDCCENEVGGMWDGIGNCHMAVPGPFVPPSAPV